VESTCLFDRARDELLLTKDKKGYDITRNFLQAKTFTKNCLRYFLLRKKKYFFGKVFKTFQKKGL